MKAIWSIYLIRCSDGSLYTGITTDVIRRLEMHRTGKGAKYLKTRRPLELVFSKEVGNRSQASKLEYAVKQLSKAKKEQIVSGEFDCLSLLPVDDGNLE